VIQKLRRYILLACLLTDSLTFYIQYIDPELHTVRSYYPDFVFIDENEKYVIVEVKGDDKWDDAVVLKKKEYVEQIAVASGMRYEMVKGSEVEAREYRKLLR